MIVSLLVTCNLMNIDFTYYEKVFEGCYTPIFFKWVWGFGSTPLFSEYITQNWFVFFLCGNRFAINAWHVINVYVFAKYYFSMFFIKLQSSLRYLIIFLITCTDYITLALKVFICGVSFLTLSVTGERLD